MELTSLRNLFRLRQGAGWRWATLFGLSAALWAAQAWGQTAFLTTTDFTMTLQRQVGGSWFDLSTADALTYLNQARCQCATPVQILVQMVAASRSKLSGLSTVGTQARLYVGVDCAQLNTAVIPNAPYCPDSQVLGELSGIESLAQGPWVVTTTVDKLFTAVGGCGANLDTTIWLWLDSTGRGIPDESVTGAYAPNLGIQLVGIPTPAPSGITVEGSDEALMVSWSPLSTVVWPDLAGYLVFCTRGDDLQVFNPSYYNKQYLTGQILCQASAPVAPTASAPSSAAGITTAIEIGAPSMFQKLDPNYLCSGLLPPTQTSLRLGTLQNGILYTVGVAAMDNSGNASPIQSGFVQVPNAPAGGLGKSGCSCHFAGVNRSAAPWGAMLALGVASRLRRRINRKK
jgi:hypothetical protein